MNFLSMKYFLALTEERSFTKAAEKLHITQQTLSAHLAGLEKEVGMKLFVRHVPLELTDGGEVFYRYAQLFERNERDLRRELSDVSGSESGVLRIGVAPARGQVLLPPIIEAFHERYPHVRIQLSEMANEAIWHALKRDEIDLALAHSYGPMPGITQQEYEKEKIILLLPISWLEAHLEDEGRIQQMKEAVKKEPLQEIPFFLADCPFLLNSEEDIAGALARKLFQRANFEPHVLVQSENMNTMLHLCVRGLGAYFCPQNLAEAMLTDKEKSSLCMLDLQEGTYTISFGYQERSHRWSMIDNFIQTAKR